MDYSKTDNWRSVAEAILNETDPEALSRLVTQLCQALDSAVGAKKRGALGGYYDR
jgi:hypothetical protein